MKDVLIMIEEAQTLVCKLCTGEAEWTMRVPMDEERDTDCVLSNTLLAARMEIVRLRQRKNHEASEEIKSSQPDGQELR